MKFVLIFVVAITLFQKCHPTSTLLWLDELTKRYAQQINVGMVENETLLSQLKLVYESYHPVIKRIEPSNILKLKLESLREILKQAETTITDIAAEGEEIKRSFNNSIRLTNQDIRFYNKESNDSVLFNELVKQNQSKFYFNAKCNCGLQLPEGYQPEDCYQPPGGFERSELFLGQNVSFHTSAVHIPLEVYNEGWQVLNDVAWTQNLDMKFKEKLCSSGTRWMFVGTNTGVFRYFPAKPWNTQCLYHDLHDVTKVSWFVKGMTSPKDVLIMIDTSGSIIGITLSLIQTSVKKLMSTLTENDFFNIFVFNKEPKFLQPSCPNLMQATPKHKQMAAGWLSNLTVHNSSAFEKGFDFAFEILTQPNSLNTTHRPIRAGCNSAILLFTDGGAAYPSQVFKKWNLDKEVRVFTYSVGKPFSSTTTLKQMACNNRGEFTTIPSYSATNLQTRKYLSKLGRPLAFNQKKTNKWTLPYVDHIGSIGSVMTVTRPIYEDYIDDVTAERKLAVSAIVGTDILHDDVQQALDVSEFGSNVYSFGVDNNGFLFHHPKLKQGRLNEPATVDISDVAIATNITQIRKKMIKRLTEDFRVIDMLVSMDGQHINNEESIYSISPVQDSLFSGGISFPLRQLNQLDSGAVVEQRRITFESILFNETNIKSFVYGLQCIKIPADETCQSTIQITRVSTNILMSDVTRETLCAEGEVSKSRFDDLLLHGSVTRRLAISYWKNHFTDSQTVLSVFVASDSLPSVMRVKHISSSYHKEIEEILSEPTSKDFFKRSLHVDPPFTTYTIMKLVTMSMDDVTTTPSSSTTAVFNMTTSFTITKINPQHVIVASQALHIPTTPRIVPAVTGAVLDHELLKQQLFNISSQQCIGQNCDWSYNCWAQERMCVVLDDGGLLMITNQDQHSSRVGQFFGLVDGDLMKALVRDRVYARVQIDDHQMVCKSDAVDGNAAARNYVLITNILKIFEWLASSIWFVLQSIVYVTITSASALTTVEFNSNEITTPSVELHHCIVRKTIFHFGNQVLPQEGSVECLEHWNRTYQAARIPNSNLIMVVVDTGAQCCDENNFCFQPIQPEELQFEVRDEIPCSKNRYRAPPSECFDVKSLPEEQDTECSSCDLQPNVVMQLIFMLFLALILR
ncbi:voltage-dependent calcium channel subunit alpha-2/delta-1 [Ciona intestinalis]